MERKRKLPARAARVEAVSKKRTSTPPEQRTQTPTPTAPPPVVEESLPKSLVPGKPLPTLDAPQPENLSSKEYQSISESGVLASSLQQSRAKWLSEGIFEKYWTKPTKKKGNTEQPENNPPKDSMTKLGTCTITVEPHIFEATMYAIKDQTPRPPIPTITQPMYRPIIQYGPPGGMMPPPAPPAPSPVQQKPPLPPQPTAYASPKTQDAHMAGSSPAAAPNNPQIPGAHTNGVPGALPNGHSPATPSHPPPAPPTQSGGKSTDPVIQMLAERASTDPDLKALMRIVANGEASADELKKFQGHIDELTKLEKARQAAAQPPAPANLPPPPPPSAAQPPQTNGQPPKPSQSPAPAMPVKTAPTPPPAPRPEPQFQPQPQALRSKGPLPSSKPDISGVVFEFSGGNGDRYLFPKNSILEDLPGGQVVASFLIVRRGSSSDSHIYDPAMDYYQPITIRLYAHQGRQLDALKKVVNPQEEVRRYMDHIMDNTTRAEYVLLAMRLPRDSEQTPPTEMDIDTERTEPMDNQVLWPTTHPTPLAPAAKAKPAPRLLTEEEKHRNFIASVAATAV